MRRRDRAEEGPSNSLCHEDRCFCLISHLLLSCGWDLWETMTSNVLARHAAGLWKLEARMFLNTLQHREWSPSPNIGSSALNGNRICVGPSYSERDQGNGSKSDCVGYLPWHCYQIPPRSNLKGRVYLGSWVVGTPSIIVGKPWLPAARWLKELVAAVCSRFSGPRS